MGWPALGVAVAVALGARTAAAQSGNQQAYDLSITCFEADAVASDDAEKLGKKELAASYKAKAKASFDAVMKLGGMLGYSGPAIQQDFDAAQQRELPKLVQDQAYFQKVAATCRALELM